MSTYDGLLEEERVRHKHLQALADELEKKRSRRDRSYSAEIDRLIPKASAVADDRVGPIPRRTDAIRRFAWGQAWSREFHREMDRLAQAKGIRTTSQQVAP